jgi:phosphoethanolamine N-methyltransferase
MDQQDEYYDNMITMLELIWGQGYMAPGGAGNVKKMLNGIETEGKRILDIGCGLGGPAFEMTNTFGADVVGIDLGPHLSRELQIQQLRWGCRIDVSFELLKQGLLIFQISHLISLFHQVQSHK